MKLGKGEERFLETTRGQLVTALRRGPATVDALAAVVGLTDNAVRAHLTSLERDGLVRQRGTRRGPGAGKPATLFELRPEAETHFSRAYAPVLRALIEELVERLPPGEVEAVLDGLGRRLANDFRNQPNSPATPVESAVAVLHALGGLVEVDRSGPTPIIRGHGCPLAVAVERRPEACRAVRALLDEVTGADVRLCCTYAERPSCCFEVTAA